MREFNSKLYWIAKARQFISKNAETLKNKWKASKEIRTHQQKHTAEKIGKGKKEKYTHNSQKTIEENRKISAPNTHTNWEIAYRANML